MNELEERIRDLRAATFLGCGDVARRVQSALKLYGIESRLVAIVTKGEWDGVSDGHTALCIKRQGRWEYIDPFTNTAFQMGDRILSLYEVLNLTDPFEHIVSLDGGTPVIQDWMRRIYHVPLIFDGTYFWTYDEETVKRQPDYRYQPGNEWVEKFYGCN